jgi:hypothetical protein
MCHGLALSAKQLSAKQLEDHVASIIHWRLNGQVSGIVGHCLRPVKQNK